MKEQRFNHAISLLTDIENSHSRAKAKFLIQTTARITISRESIAAKQNAIRLTTHVNRDVKSCAETRIIPDNTQQYEIK
jgi:hypothetical protein